jgi:hypothetical protein
LADDSVVDEADEVDDTKGVAAVPKALLIDARLASSSTMRTVCELKPNPLVPPNKKWNF